MRLRKWETAALALCVAIGTSLDAVQAQYADDGGQYQSANDAAGQAGASLDAIGFEGSVESYGVGGYDSGDGCNSGSCAGSSGSGLDFGLLSRPGQFFFGATYIYARADFSEALAYVEQDAVAGGDTFHMYDFDYNSSYSFDGGYRLCDCGGEIRFNFTRLRSEADFTAINSNGSNIGLFSPYEIDAPGTGQQIQGDVDVDLRSYDLGFAKTIPLGSPLGSCDCGDTCGADCGSGCGSGWCPAWDIKWSAGLRFAEVEWARGTVAFDTGGQFIDTTVTRMDFEGTGARVGLEGRRYIGRRGRFSVYAKGDISLLVGRVNIETLTTGTAGPAGFTRASFKNIIPVTEIEVGGSVHIRDHITLTAGYFLSAWHDLGMRDEYDFSQFQLGHYDDANILGFDGYFTRAEIAF